MEETATETIDLALPSSFVKAVALNKDRILEGRMVAIDPGSCSPGYAIYEAGICVDSGTIKPPRPRHLHHRLQDIAEAITELTHDADILVVEKIGRPNKKTVITSYLPLIKSIGAIHSASTAEYMLEIMPITWQKLTGDNYTKSDENDAMMLAECAKYIAENI